MEGVQPVGKPHPQSRAPCSTIYAEVTKSQSLVTSAARILMVAVLAGIIHGVCFASVAIVAIAISVAVAVLCGTGVLRRGLSVLGRQLFLLFGLIGALFLGFRSGLNFHRLLFHRLAISIVIISRGRLFRCFFNRAHFTHRGRCGGGFGPCRAISFWLIVSIVHRLGIAQETVRFGDRDDGCFYRFRPGDFRRESVFAFRAGAAATGVGVKC